LFANFAEAVAEGRGKAQAESLKKTRTESQAKLLTGSGIPRTAPTAWYPAPRLTVGDIVLVEAGDQHPVRRRGHRRRCFCQRGRDHRRIGSGDP
jgi:K+-transporting ATPase ATPase B chain